MKVGSGEEIYVDPAWEDSPVRAKFFRDHATETAVNMAVVVAGSYTADLWARWHVVVSGEQELLRNALSRLEKVETRLSRLETETVSSTAVKERLLSSVRKVSALSKYYRVDDIDEIVEHVAERSTLPELLVVAAEELKGRFEGEALSLCSTGEKLLISVDTKLEVEEAEARFSKFLREWWTQKVSLEDRTGVTLRYL